MLRTIDETKKEELEIAKQASEISKAYLALETAKEKNGVLCKNTNMSMKTMMMVNGLLKVNMVIHQMKNNYFLL